MHTRLTDYYSGRRRPTRSKTVRLEPQGLLMRSAHVSIVAQFAAARGTGRDQAFVTHYICRAVRTVINRAFLLERERLEDARIWSIYIELTTQRRLRVVAPVVRSTGRISMNFYSSGELGG
jgi:hypothetical protein